MKSFMKYALALAALTVTSAAVAKPRHFDDGTTIVARTAYGVGEVAINDPRILDLSGEYTLTAGTTVSVTLSIVQDSRGKLTGSFTLVDAEGTSGTFPAVGSLAVERKQPLRFEFSGSTASTRDAAKGQGNGDGKGNGNGNGSSRPGTSNGGRKDVRARGVFDGTQFVTELRLKSSTGESRTTVTLVPVNPLRGALVSDGQGFAPRPGTLVSTRTVTLPWGSRVLPAFERTHRRTTQFSVASNIPRKGKPLGQPLPFGLRVHGSTGTAGEFNTLLSHVRLGYGHLDSATSTTVTKSAFAPVSVWEGTDTTSEPIED